MRMIGAASFNGINLLASGTVTLQVGANSGESLAVSLTDVASTLGTAISTFATATSATVVSIGAIDNAVDSISTTRATYGAIQNRLEHTANSLGVYQENLMSAESRIRDVDMAEEMTNFTRLQILQQSGTAILAQANSQSSSVLSLLK